MKYYFKASFLLLLILIFWSCHETEISDLEDATEISLKNTEMYSIDLLISGDEEGATIITQAQHFLVSELKRDESTSWSVVYNYKPSVDYVGTDYVEIETCTGGVGLTCTNLDTLKIRFQISE